MFSETEATESGAKVISSEIGIDTATISVVTRLRRNRYRTITASNPPRTAVLRTSAMLPSMNSERSETTVNTAPSER